jgi:hypothetical protein
MAMQALRESAKTLRIGMIAGDGIGRLVIPVRLSSLVQMLEEHADPVCRAL